ARGAGRRRRRAAHPAAHRRGDLGRRPRCRGPGVRVAQHRQAGRRGARARRPRRRGRRPGRRPRLRRGVRGDGGGRRCRGRRGRAAPVTRAGNPLSVDPQTSQPRHREGLSRSSGSFPNPKPEVPVPAPRPLLAALAALTTALVACSTGSTGTPSAAPEEAPPPPIELEGDWTWTPQPGPLELGVTHTQKSLDESGSDPEARRRGIEILSADAAIWQNHHLMGFGTSNPEPEPGEYDWDTLDQRMRLTEQTGQRTMLTLCCAPDWMKGGEEGETDWDELEEAPLPEHFDDFARLAAEAVTRYPQIERVMVWNELKGFWHDEENRWDYEGYTDLYNRVYRAVKDARPDVQVGGPYVVLISLDPGARDTSPTVTGPWGAADQRTLDVIDYWLEHNVGADFLAVDAASN